MIPALQTKSAVVTAPGAQVNNASATCTAVDTIGWDYARFRLFLGATDIALTAWKVQQCDTSGGSYADIATSDDATGTTGDGRLPTATDDNNFFDILIDLRGKMRFMKPVITVGNGTTGAYLACECELYRGQIGPSSAADQGVAGRIVVT